MRLMLSPNTIISVLETADWNLHDTVVTLHGVVANCSEDHQERRRRHLVRINLRRKLLETLDRFIDGGLATNLDLDQAI